MSYAKGNSGGAEVLEENNYYPFGLKHEGYAGLGNPNYKYGFVGNELQENGLQDMNARFYIIHACFLKFFPVVFVAIETSSLLTSTSEMVFFKPMSKSTFESIILGNPYNA